jgi:hypothetical protein
MKVKIRILLTEGALDMVTELQDSEPRPLSHVVEECIRLAYNKIKENDDG